MTERLAPLILKAAQDYQLSPALIASVIHQESGGNVNAVRYEPLFFRKYLSPYARSELKGYWSDICSFKTEQMLRAVSWGLMQIMGQTAREHGFKGDFLTELLDPAANIDLGTKILAEFIQKKGDVEKGLLRWNGGGEPKYPSMVLKHIEAGTYQHLLV